MKAYNKFLTVEVQESTASGIIIDAAVDLLTGKVLSVGYDVKEITKGATILFDRRKALESSGTGKKKWHVSFEGILEYENSK